MCGIAGLLFSRQRDADVIRAMTNRLAHRGPDDGGIWEDAEAGVALGHRRLSIVDLSPAGHEPMHSADGRFVITFNGEIYNFEELRSALENEGAVPEGGWRGHSDVEVFLEAIAAGGVEQAVKRSAGMFAFALWDRKERTLTLARDRFGEKPLYYGWVGRDLVFASELKAIRAHPRFDNPLDRRSLEVFLCRTNVPAPLSIYRRLFKLPPGCLLHIDAGGVFAPLDAPPREEVASHGIRLTRYWSYRDVVSRGIADPIDNEGEALLQLEQVLGSCIRQQSFADVPVGAFLSGGIDSSTIVALYQKHSAIPVRTFSIGFEDAEFNEAENAKAVAKHLGTVHDEQYVTAEKARDVIPLLPAMYDEPFADSSQIPTYLVSRFARSHVTVALTGDGGDELFGGYNRHSAAPRLWRGLQRVPRRLRAAAGSPLAKLPPQFWGGAASLMAFRRQPHVGSKVRKLIGTATGAASFEDVHRSLVEEWSQAPVPEPTDWPIPFDLDAGPGASDAVRMMYCDAVSFLPDDILCKVDRAAMSVGLETRVPFLDHRVAELAARIPVGMKIRSGKGKAILRALLGRHVPTTLIDRPKTGFGVPVGAWLKGPLRAWAEELLDPRAMDASGWLDANQVGERWRAHLSGREDSTAALWAVLMFQAWMREQDTANRAAA